MPFLPLARYPHEGLSPSASSQDTTPWTEHNPMKRHWLLCCLRRRSSCGMMERHCGGRQSTRPVSSCIIASWCRKTRKEAR